MGTLIEKTLWQNPSVYVTEEQLAHFLDGTPDSRYARLNRAIKKGYLTRVKRGLYCLGARLSPLKGPHPFELAQLIYGPSYISLESALSYYGLIPEAVPAIAAVTIKRNRKFQTSFGQFIYRHLPTDNFFIGVEYIKEDSHQFFIASPWKAILDYIYCYKKEWQNLDSIRDSLRIELEELPKISVGDLEQLKTFYHSKRIEHFINNIPREFIDER